MVAAQVEVFLSYSRNDSAICRWIAAGLATAGCTVWRDEAAVKAGDTWVRSIFRGIESADFIVPLLSASALASPWVRKEIDTALRVVLLGGATVGAGVLASLAWLWRAGSASDWLRSASYSGMLSRRSSEPGIGTSRGALLQRDAAAYMLPWHGYRASGRTKSEIPLAQIS